MSLPLPFPPFCPHCRALLPPEAPTCPRCGWQRPLSSLLPAPGEPFWRALLDFSPRGALAVGDTAVFWGGDRGGAGALAALEQATGTLRWRCAAPHLVAGGIAYQDGRLYFGTVGLGEGALFCLEATTGQVVWHHDDLPAGIWGQPVLFDAWGLVGLDNGLVWAFDLRDGQRLSLNLSPLPKGRVWTVKTGQEVVIFSEEGEVVALDAHWRRLLWPRPYALKARLSGPPAVRGKQIFFGVERGEVWALEVLNRRARPVMKGLPNVRAAPALGEGILLVGGVGADHRLWAYDLEAGRVLWQSEPFEHSIATTPAVSAGLVAAAANGGQIVLLKLASGERLWTFNLPTRAVPAHPLFHRGVVYAASDQGEVVALPWHLGQYEQAAAFLEQQGDAQGAGLLYAWAALDADIERRATLRGKALRLWDRSPHPEWAAYLAAEDLGAAPAEIGARFERAGEFHAFRDLSLASACLGEASAWYEEVEEENRALACLRKIGRLNRGPYLHIRSVNIPQRWQEEVTHQVWVEVKNLGHSPAHQVRVRFAGALHQRIWISFDTLAPHQSVELQVPLAAREPGVLEVEARYLDERQQALVSRKTFRIQEVLPFTGFLIEGSMAGVIDLKDLPRNVKMIIRDSEAGTIRLSGAQGEATPEGGRPTVIFRNTEIGTVRIGGPEIESSANEVRRFMASLPPQELAAVMAQEEVLLTRREVVEDAFVVSAGYQAIFLADEAAVGRFPPGRYRRKDLPALRPSLGRPRPQWEVVLFRQSAFRLAFPHLGPFRTKEGAPVGAHCGLTGRFVPDRLAGKWHALMGTAQQVTTRDLEGFLRGEVQGVLEQWVSARPTAEILPAFARREELMLSLQEALRDTMMLYGVEVLDPLYSLHFVPLKQSGTLRVA